MNFIEDDGFASEGKETEGRVFDRENGEQSLVDGADSKRGKESAAAGSEPADRFIWIAACIDGRDSFFVEPRATMNQCVGVIGLDCVF